MYLIYAPLEKFGRLPSGTPLLTTEVPFYQNVAYCPKFYWKKHHCIKGCIDITPNFLNRLRKKRDLFTILVFAPGGIGDSMWCMPFCLALKKKYPNSRVVVAVNNRSAPLWRNLPYISGIVENHYLTVQNLVRLADEVWDFTGIATVIKKLMRMDPIEAIFHEADFPLPKSKEDCRPKLILTLEEGQRTAAILKQNDIEVNQDTIISIALETSTPNRNYPFAYIKEISQKFIQEGKKVIWLAESKEFDDVCLDEETKKIGAINLTRKTNLREVMSVLALSDLFIGVNSGLLVIATALKTPTVGLFGAFNPKIRAKFYERFDVIWGKPSCSPCNEHWTECRMGYPAPCMKMITPDQVYSKCIKMLLKYPRKILEKIPIT